MNQTENSPQHVALFSRKERAALLAELLGEKDPEVLPFAVGIRNVTHAQFDKHVLPLIDEHWSALKTERFYEKLRIGACDLYAAAPYTALFCSEKSPRAVRAVTRLGNALPISKKTLAALGRIAIEAFGRLSHPKEQRRIVLVAAFIVVVDHVFDHVMRGPAEERSLRLFALLEGKEKPASPELALTLALSTEMGKGLNKEENRVFQTALSGVFAWIRAEVRGMNNTFDPTGLGHRTAGVEGTIDGLLFPVANYTSPATRKWMVDVSMFVQHADDWLDAEQDARDKRITPVLSGHLQFHSLELAWKKTLVGIEELVRGAGLTSPSYVQFVRNSYVLMMIDVLSAMIERPDQ